MAEKLPLDSPLWLELSACYSAGDAVARLREVVAARRLGDAWKALQDEILHQGSVYAVTSAAIPHLVDLAPHLPDDERRALWTELGFLVTAGADEFPDPAPAGLQAALDAALRTAAAAAPRDFRPDGDAEELSYVALACVALAGHPVGTALWEFPDSSAGYVPLTCPRCDSEVELDGFGDPVLPSVAPPVYDAPPVSGTAWQRVADAIGEAGRSSALSPGWDGFLQVAHVVAAAGVPVEAPAPPVWTLVAAMVAAHPAWARTLTRLTGHYRCPGCEEVVPIWVAYGEPSYVDDPDDPDDDDDGAGEDEDSGDDEGRIDPATVATGDGGFRPAPGFTPARLDVTVETVWQTAGPAVTALAAGPDLLAAARGGRVHLVDPRTGQDTATLFDAGAPVTALTAAALPDGSAAVAAAAGAVPPVQAVTGASSVPAGGPVLALATVPMPAEPNPRTVAPLAALWDGRSVVAAATGGSVVHLWNPATRSSVAEAFRHPGTATVALATVPHDSGADLIALRGGHAVDVWSSAAVMGTATPGRPGAASCAPSAMPAWSRPSRRRGGSGSAARCCSRTATAACRCGRRSTCGSPTRCHRTRGTATSSPSRRCRGTAGSWS
ncbi:hypothetical protein OHA72_33330 [Dactylosporangium sp. NBC_01737]|uniref:hypothetical protein n=1 Tax=Dactylosporangium sp. NBC_01737 TaxID=2975959 RepID=UPI002E153967|nr:hypothetical protein OHA72_33330 [Dactylosporangium sp. NBC_01737]